jgi:UDP-N-acetylmuramate dehydrogenase
MALTDVSNYVMEKILTKVVDIEILQSELGRRLEKEVDLARFTAARVGGPAEAFVRVNSTQEMIEVVRLLWKLDIPFLILGGGSNILVSDLGVRKVVVYNRARQVRFDLEESPPNVWVDSGANLGVVARQCASRGLSGLEWAAGIPGTVGGAVVGNAGAHGSEMSTSLVMAEILHRNFLDEDRLYWPVERFEYNYRWSVLKENQGDAVVLRALIRLKRESSKVVQARIDEFNAYRRMTQPPGASMGSMFKNPPGDHAGRLIEEVGLKGTRIGGAEISQLHANFFINKGNASAMDVYNLIQLAHQRVVDEFGISLELEIELVGEWHQ